MKNKILIICFIFATLLYAESEFYFTYKGSNKNFTYASRSLSDRNKYTYNYDRLRTDLELGWEKKFSFKLIFDLENYLGKNYITNADFQTMQNYKFDFPLNPYHNIVSENAQILRSYLYRCYSTFYLDQSTLVLGYQRIPLGVGRLWSPTDIINPYNPLSIEPAERLGVYGALYTYNLAELMQFKTFFTQNRYSQLKDYGYVLKTNYEKWDAGISYVENKDQRMTGVEIERELFSTGIEVRTEIAQIKSTPLDKTYQKYILGLDYGFPNSTYLVVEYLHNELGENNKADYELARLNLTGWDQLAKDYLGSTLSYEFTPLVRGSASAIVNLSDGSFFISPAILWSLETDLDLHFGCSTYAGSKYSEFWYYQSMTYVSLSNYF